MKILVLLKLVIFVTIMLLPLSMSYAQPTVLTSRQWQEDLAFLAKEIPKAHREPFHKISKSSFDSAVAVLHTQIPSMKDYEIVVGFTKLVAMIGDGHTRLTLPQDQAVAYSRAHTTTSPPSDSSLFFNHLPVKLELFKDGLFIRSATPAYKHMVGAQVLQIGNTSADAAIKAVRPVVHYDNEMGFKLLAPTFLVVPEFLASLNIANDSKKVKFQVKTRQGKVENITLTPVPLFNAPAFTDAYDVLKTSKPLSQRDKKSKFWMEYLPDTKTLYVQVNEVNNKEDETMAEFMGKMEKAITAHSVGRLVLDLRYNPGGNNTIGRSIVLVLARNEHINQPGRLYTLIGPETFSAAQVLANDLEYYTNTLFAGEPSGSSPSHYGDSRKMYLPNSNLTIRASSIYWRDWNGNEKRPWTAPHIPVSYTSDDYLKGRDPALETVLKLPLSDNVGAVMQQVYEQNGFMPAAWVYTRFAWDSRANHSTVEAVEKAFGDYLLKQNKGEEAVIWYNSMGIQRKGTLWPYLGLAQAYLLLNDKEKVESILKKAIMLEPDNKQANEMLKAIKE
ncbi:S41 family peptidase [Pontibacter toksunensis]|uniref:S41 family peptidase n=1 Tax=Pontibacter toksunensis TaxID=1332631 RepID=A0ABW6C2A3_9BACT